MGKGPKSLVNGTPKRYNFKLETAFEQDTGSGGLNADRTRKEVTQEWKADPVENKAVIKMIIT